MKKFILVIISLIAILPSFSLASNYIDSKKSSKNTLDDSLKAKIESIDRPIFEERKERMIDSLRREVDNLRAEIENKKESESISIALKPVVFMVILMLGFISVIYAYQNHSIKLVCFCVIIGLAALAALSYI